MRPNHALQRTRPSRPGCNPASSWAGSLSLGREGGEFDTEFFGEFAQGSFGGEDAAAAGSVIDRVLAGSPGGVGDGDCFLVDVESDVVGFGHNVFRYDINVG